MEETKQHISTEQAIKKIAAASAAAASKLIVASDIQAAKLVKMSEDVASKLVDVATRANEALTKLTAIKAEEAVKVVKNESGGDHDLLIRVDERIEMLIAVVTEIKTGTTAKIDEHETRLKDVEKKVSNAFITNAIYTLATIALIGLMVSHMIIK